MKKSSLVAGIAVGFVSAGIATLLSAPRSGGETRACLQQTYKSSKDCLQTISLQAKQVSSQTATVVDLAKSVGKQTASELSQSIEQWKIDTKPATEALQRHIHEAQASISQLNQDKSRA
ncbi:hypothetical protein CHH78_02810 [Shouchella clausii]|uniref:YtxH domain-containing protein n=1 Tax=Shouchella clausii TaxID=79880 RepID=UPI000BA7D337|nr:YtxH domain-containing protein [Shouchella clausii]MBU8595206.1 YtxH domain-containing protein [Shouchella clausii]PAD10752.1 hypothetical protein CHH76_02770 [Shouchella clausii]PAE86080.1 hypothetical protein CHH78_02810 [Shouchella clausii]PAF06583.1 hypothetical protein CHH66_03835 [Shouchella clausii]